MPWITLLEALAFVTGANDDLSRKEKLLVALRQGAVPSGRLLPNGTIQPLEPKFWGTYPDNFRRCRYPNSEIDWERSMIAKSPNRNVANSERLCFYPVRIEQKSPIDFLENGKIEQKPKGGRPFVYKWEDAVTGVLVQYAHGKGPEPQDVGDVRKLLSEWFLEHLGREPGDTELKAHAAKLWKALQG